MKIIEILDSLPLLKQLSAEKGLSPRAKFKIARNCAVLNDALRCYEDAKKGLIESLNIGLEPMADTPELSKLVFENKEQETSFLQLHKPLLEEDVKLPYSIASLELIEFLTASDLLMMGDFVDTSDLG